MNNKISFWLFGIAIILLGVSIFLNISKTVVSNESIVLAFVGILATFIVVGNYSQVSEIRNNTEKRIKELEFETQKKIDQLNKLFDNEKKILDKLIKTEKETYFATAEAYRLFGLYTRDKKLFKHSTKHFINALTYYYKADNDGRLIDIIYNGLLKNLSSESWKDPECKEKFNFEEFINRINNLPNHNQKQEILELLEKYKKEEISE